jgi:hypothetical protein
MPVPNDIFQTMPARAYADMRDEIQNGDVLLFSGIEVFSHVIRWATASPWSHVGFVFRLGEIDRVMVLEAITKGVTTEALSVIVNGNGASQKAYAGRLAIARHQDFASLVTEANLREMSKFAVDRFGDPYANVEIFKIVARIVFGRLNMKTPPLLEADDEYICSEYAAACYARIGITIPWDGLGFIAPSDFAADPKINPIGVVQTAGLA